MKIILSPIRMDRQLAVSLSGDVLSLNGEPFDFSPLPEGATLPLDAFSSDWFAGPVDRVNGELIVSLVLPYGPNAPDSTVFYTGSLMVSADGAIDLPTYDAPPEELPDPDIEIDEAPNE